MNFSRWANNLFATPWGTRRRFTPAVLQDIELAITQVESRHAGEIRFAIETSLDVPELWQRVSARERALQVFGRLGVWDTANNNGVLIYVLMSEHSVEIIADRGIAQSVAQADWAAVCDIVQEHYRAERYLEGSRAAVEGVGELLAKHFPNQGGDRNEQPNRPVLL